MKGIPFSSQMVRAIQNTRINEHPAWPIDPAQGFKRVTRRLCRSQDLGIIRAKGPGYKIGQVYVVREGLYKGTDGLAYYQADDACVDPLADRESCWGWKRDKLPGIFMPDRAGRLYVRVLQAEPQRLSDMTGMDCVWEGLTIDTSTLDPFTKEAEETAYLDAFADLFDSLHGPGTWAKNPWVWVYQLQRVSCMPK